MLLPNELEKYSLLIGNRVSEIENKIGAGLIEEVIQVAEGELKLVDVLAKSKVYVLPHASSKEWYGLLTELQMGRS